VGGLRVSRRRARPHERGALLVAAGLPTEHAPISLLALNGLRVSEATGADIEHLDLERRHRTLTITRQGGKVVTIPLAPQTPRAIDLAIGERTGGPVFLAADGAAGGPARHLHRSPPTSQTPPGRTRSSSLRELTASLAKTLPRWYLTLRALMNSRAPDLRVRQAVAGQPRNVDLLGGGSSPPPS
jgi:integrase